MNTRKYIFVYVVFKSRYHSSIHVQGIAALLGALALCRILCMAPCGSLGGGLLIVVDGQIRTAAWLVHEHRPACRLCWFR
jgi:hypothetical protein